MVKTLTIVHGFWPESEIFDFGRNITPYKSTSQGEQNGANFSSIASSSEEL